MSTLSITRNYADGEILLEADLDEICDDVEAFLNTELLGDANIADASITASEKLIDSSISTGKLAASAVTTAKINDLAVTTAKINDLAVTTGKINDLAVTNAKMSVGAAIANVGALGVLTANINDLAVTTAKIAALNVTPEKLSARLQATANTTSATGITTSSSLACTFTGTGRPVMLCLSLSIIPSSATPIFGFTTARTVKIYKDGVAFLTLYTTPDNLTVVTVPVGTYFDMTGKTGSVTYDLRTDAGSCGPAAGETLTLTAVEL